MTKDTNIIITTENFLTIESNQIVFDLYLPIIGYKAAFLYSYLHNFLLKTNKYEDSVYNLIIFTGFNLEEFTLAKKTLESIGLIKSFESVFAENTILIKILKPKDPAAFLDDIILKGILASNIGKENFDKITKKYKLDDINFDEFVEKTASFKDTFNPEFDIETLNYDQGIKFTNSNNYDVTSNFDEDKFKNYFFKHSYFTEDVLNDEVMQKFRDYAVLYSIDEEILAEIAVNSMSRKDDDKYAPNFDYVLRQISFHLKTKKNYKKLINKDSLVIDSNTDLATKIRYYQETSPRIFLKEKQGGTEPVQADINLIYHLNDSFNFTPGMITCLFDYVLTQKDGVLDSAYVTKLAATLKRKKCSNVLDVINALNNKKSSNSTKNEQKSTKKEETASTDLLADFAEFFDD